MKIPKKKYIAPLLFVSFFFAGCLKDDVSPAYNINLSDNAKLLYYLEDEGDYINSPEMPSVVNVDEVFNNLNNYLIIDVRTNTEFSAGHISGAINIQNDSLLAYINSINVSQYQKIILVSSDGQASSYYTCLLRLYGISNSYSLLFGMAEWNNAFSDAWTKNLHDSPIISKFNFADNSPNSLSRLPDINFPSGKSSGDGVKQRISTLLKTGFINNETYVTINPPDSLEFNNQPITDFYIICFASRSFYLQNPFDPTAPGHFPSSVSYVPGKDIKSVNNLQTLPTNKKIVVYCYSGQLSAFLVAYLRVHGYDAKSLLYGGDGLFYSYMLKVAVGFAPYGFLTSDIRNYPTLRAR